MKQLGDFDETHSAGEDISSRRPIRGLDYLPGPGLLVSRPLLRFLFLGCSLEAWEEEGRRPGGGRCAKLPEGEKKRGGPSIPGRRDRMILTRRRARLGAGDWPGPRLGAEVAR